MRKTLLSLILILLTATLFVACSSSPKEDELPYVAEITVTGSGDYADYTGTYYLKGGDDHFSGEETGLDLYVLYNDKECTDPLIFLMEDEMPFEYSFSIGLKYAGHTMYSASIMNASTIHAHQDKEVIPATYSEIGESEYWNASFYAGNEFSFSRTFSENLMEVSVKFVKDTTLICENYT